MENIPEEIVEAKPNCLANILQLKVYFVMSLEVLSALVEMYKCPNLRPIPLDVLDTTLLKHVPLLQEINALTMA